MPAAQGVTPPAHGGGLDELIEVVAAPVPDPAALADALERADAALADADGASAARWLCAARAHAPLDPTLAISHASALRIADRVPDARRVLETAAHETTWRNSAEEALALGAALLEVGAPREALTCFEHVTRARPRDPAGWAALAGALRALGRPTEAWRRIEKAKALGPVSPALCVTAAQIRHELGDPLGTAHWFDRAERLRPGHAPTRVQRAYTVLMDGDANDGWAMFEDRSRPAPRAGVAEWQGETLDGRSIAVLAEQGVGDQFQFLRFVRRLWERGASRVVVEAHPSAVTLLRAAGYEAVPRGEAPVTDVAVPLLSLPHRLALGDEVDGVSVPYIRLDAPTPADAPHEGRRRLGLVWAGNPAFPGRTLRDFDRALLPRLAAIPGISWCVLQQGESAAPFAAASPAKDWLDTARTLRTLDALVTTDTGIAHLAGAMGVRTYVLLQHVPDWRWGRSGTTTPWYPASHLVRQRRPNDWASVVEVLPALLAPG